MRRQDSCSGARPIRAAVLGLLLAVLAPPLLAQTSFLVAGHAYGRHVGDNPALCDPLRRALEREDLARLDFMVLAGDFVRRCDRTALDQLERELKALGIPTYLVMGNHEETTPLCRSWVEERHGGTFYRFERGGAHFVVLDSQRDERSIPPDQLAFLRDALERASAGDPVFVFFHELLWLSRDRYRYVRANRRSRHANLHQSNYWEDVQPILETHADKRIFVVAGDVGGNPDAVPAFFEEIGHVSLIATGMGGIDRGNYLRVEVAGSDVHFTLVALDPAQEPFPALESFDPATLSRLDALGRPMTSWAVWRRWIWEHRRWGIVGLVVAALGALLWWFRKRRGLLREDDLHR